VVAVVTTATAVVAVMEEVDAVKAAVVTAVAEAATEAVEADMVVVAAAVVMAVAVTVVMVTVDLGTLQGVNPKVVAGGVRFIWLLVGYDIKTLVSSQACLVPGSLVMVMMLSLLLF